MKGTKRFAMESKWKFQKSITFDFQHIILTIVLSKKIVNGMIILYILKFYYTNA